MAYSIIEQATKDLDIYFKDKFKLIHIASAGGNLPNQLAENDLLNEDFASTITNFEELYEFEVNPNLTGLLNLNDTGLDLYLIDFVLMAKRGFYSYDKTILGDFSNPMFHLVARPILTDNAKAIVNTEILLKIGIVLPTHFDSFNLFDLFVNK